MTCKRCHDRQALYCIRCLNELLAEVDVAARKAEETASRYRGALQVLLKHHIDKDSRRYIIQTIREILEGGE